MDAITREEWTRLHPDFQTVIDGQPYMLRLDPRTGATVLEPVEITDCEEGEDR